MTEMNNGKERKNARMKNTCRCILSRIFILLLVLSLVPLATVAVNAETEQSYVAMNTATGVQYTDVKKALSEADEGQTVALQQDAQTTGILTLREGRRLDLNGFTLTAKYVTSYGDIVDNCKAGSGMLKVAANRFLIQEKNRQMPVRDGDGYRFVQVLGFNEAVLNNGTKYAFQPLLEAEAAELLSAGQETTGVTITVRVSWDQTNGRRVQSFVYNDSQVQAYLSSYSESTGKYSKMFSLNLRNAEGFNNLRYEAIISSSAGVKLGVGDIPDESVGDVVADENNQITQDVTLNNDQATAVVAAGTLVEQGATKVALTTTKLDNTTSNVTLTTGEQMVSMDVHVEGVAEDNTVPVIVTINELTLNGLNQGNIALYHVENGETVAMTRVYAKADLDAHNEYYYDIATGTITVALTSFSEVTVVAEEAKAWEGEIAGGFNGGSGTKEDPYIIANADQLAYFGKQVDNGETYTGKYITMLLDVNMGYDSEKGTGISFNPIGYGYESDANGRVFKGTFDGNGNTIFNLYQNGWELGLSYSTAGGGLFASAVGATFKNLTIENAYIVMECIDMGTLVGYAYGDCTFENIVVKGSTIANYNRYTGGVIGEVGKGNHTLTNVDVDADTVVSALWGTFDPGMGGIIGGKYGSGVKVHMEKCDVACELDVFNDVTSAYRWYSYRRCGMLIGHTEETVKEESGRTVGAASFLTTEDCTVYFGDWAKYHYCQFGAMAYPFVRVEAGLFNEAYSNPRYGHPTDASGNKVTSDAHTHNDGEAHNLEIVFNQLYGGGQGCYGGNAHLENGVTVINAADPVTKFEAKVDSSYTIEPGTTLTLGQLFQAATGAEIQSAYVYAYVSPANEEQTVRGSYSVVKTGDWTQNTLKFTGEGVATVTISDYYYCEPTTITITVAVTKTDAVVTEAPVANELTYTGSAQALVSGGAAEGGKLVYSTTANGTFTETVPAGINAGIYIVYYKVQGDSTHNDSEVSYVSVNIAKATPAVTNAPTAKNLTYNGALQTLVNAGTVTGGKLVYSLTEDGTYRTSIPTGTNAGDYTVYYKIESDSNYNSAAGGSVTVTIAKAVASCTVTANKGWTYDGQEQALVTSTNLKGAAVVYGLSEDGEFTSEIPTTANAGTYTVYYKVLGNDNYLESDVKTVTVTVNKAESSITAAPVVKQELTYNKTEQPLVDAGTATGGEIWYKVEKQQTVATFARTRTVVVDEDGFSPVIPTAKNAGTYTVYYKVKGDVNHNDSAVSQVEVTVKKADPVVVPPTVNTTYGDTLENATLPDIQEGSDNNDTSGTLTWKDDTTTSVGNAGTNNFTATFVPEDTENYNTVEVKIPVQVQQAVPTYELPENLTAIYGQTLAAVTLPEGFNWKDASLSVGNAGTRTFTVVFNPGDSNYQTLELEVQITVAKADPAYTAPTGLTATYGQTLADVSLTDSFTWKDSATKVTKTDNYKATYTPADTKNYNIVEVDVLVTALPVEKFDLVFTNTDKYLYRVGNAQDSTVKLSSLFKAVEGLPIGTVEITIEAVGGTGASGIYTPNATWTNGTIQFNGTGVVRVTITDNNYCTPTELYLEVVDAVNATTATNATSGNVVLLNDIGSGFTVSGRYTVYGNGFTLNYTGNGQYLNNGLKQGVVTVSENGTLDNLRINATIYPKAYLYYGTNNFGEAVQDGPYSKEGDKTRYHYQLSAVVAKDNATISNCYIYGGRNNIFINTGDVTVKDTVLECGVVANVQIQSNSSHTVTFENVTTIQHQVNPTMGDTSLVMLGAGILVGPETTENPTIVLNGEFKQYNWVTADDASAVSNSMAQAIVNGALNATAYNHTVNGKTASNLGIIYMNTYGVAVENDTGLPYVRDDIAMKVTGNNTINGQVYSVQGAAENQIYSDVEKADKATVNGLYQPQFKYPVNLGGQFIEQTDEGDEHCYREGDTIHVMFPSGDTKELDLAALVDITKYTSQDLGLVISCKDSDGNAIAVTGGKVSLSAAGEYTVTYTVTDKRFLDKEGKVVDRESIKYEWAITVSVSLKDTAIPDARFEIDATEQKMGYYKPTIGDVKQYLPFLAGLKIYDYNGKTEYLRFDGSADFNKVASVTITGYASNKASVEIKLTDGGVINTQFLARANSGGASTYTGSIKTKNNVIYFVNGGGTSNSASTTTSAYWYVDYYRFTGNNGVAIQSGQQTFNSTGSSVSTPSGSFSTTIKYTVTYDANGGNCGQTTGYATSASAAVTLPTPTRSGYIFSGWYTAASGGTRVGGAGDSYTPSANITLYAQWGKPCTVTYNPNGGSCGTASEKYTGTALTLPTPTRDGYWFVGWYDAASGGNKIGDAGANYNPTGEITLYAHWQEKVEYTVTYNANGGSCGTASATYQGTALTLPTPTRTGYKFQGWYTAASGGTKIGDAGASYTPSANITLYAQWEINSYTITVTTSNATVKVNGNAVSNKGTVSIQYGTQVTVEVTYSETDSQSTTIKGTDGTTYTSPFKMPAQNVTINATSSAPSSSPCVTPDTMITLADGTQVRVDSLTGEEELLVWNMITGKLDSAPIMFVDSDPETEVEIIHLYFSDGTDVKVIYEHGFWDYDLNRYVYLDANAAQYIGHTFAKQNGDVLEKVVLTEVVLETEVTTAWSPVTAGHLCYFVNGMLSMPGGVDGLFNIFDVNPETMTYDQEAMARDIETYGLFTYEELNSIEPLSEEMFEAAGGAYLKISIGKGNLTMDELVYMIRRYSKYFE